MNANARGSIGFSASNSGMFPSLHLAEILTLLLIPLALVASLGGLFIPNLYREPAVMQPAMRGPDLVTVLALVVMSLALLAVRRGSARATLVWLGLLGYVFYTYTGAAFGYAFNNFFLIYVALFSLSMFTLVSAVSSLKIFDLKNRFDPATPRVSVVIALGVFAFLLTALWLAQIIPFLTSGTLPEIIKRSGGVTSFVFVLDLGLVLPLAVLSALWLWQQKPWGYVLAGYILIKAATMGLALLVMNWFSLRADMPVDPLELMAFYALLFVGGLVMAVWFLWHCHDANTASNLELQN